LLSNVQLPVPSVQAFVLVAPWLTVPLVTKMLFWTYPVVAPALP